MRTFALAWRNLLRNRRRSLMTLTAMVLGLTTVLLFGGYFRDINYAMQSDFVRRTGHLQVQHKDYFLIGSGNPAAYGIKGYEHIIRTVKADPVLAPMLVVVTPSLQFGGVAGNFFAGVSRTVLVNGIVVDDQRRLREWNDYKQRFVSRDVSLMGTPPDTAVIGAGVARVLQLCTVLDVPDCEAESAQHETRGEALPDDIAALASPIQSQTSKTQSSRRPRIEILAANARGAPNVAAVNVLSAEFQGIKELDDVYVGLHLVQAQKLIFGTVQPQVTSIAVQLRQTAQIPAARERLRELLSTILKDEPLAVVDYETLNPFYGQTVGMFAVMFGFISVLIGAIVLFTVTNTMSMVVVERTAEIGTLRAIGLRRSGIRKMFVMEGIVLGVLGAVLGIGAAIGIAWVINQFGLTWIPPGRIEPIPLAVRVVGENGMLLMSAIGLVVVAALSALLPAARAARMNIVDALRHV